MIESCLNIDVDNDNLSSHPILLIDSFKSLIGIDLKKSKKLQDILIPHIYSIINSNNMIIETNEPINSSTTVNSSISLLSLYDVLNSKDVDKSKIIISEILNVSDGKHILEYLLELSLLQSGNSFIIVSSVIRCMEFCDNPDVYKFILLATKAVIFDRNIELTENEISDEVFNIKNYLLADSQIIVYGHFIEGKSKSWIRKDKINNNLNIFRKNVFNSVKLFTYKDNYQFTEEIKTHGRVFLLDFIDGVNLNMITCDFLIRLNAIRFLIRNNVPDNVSDYYLNKLFYGIGDINE